MAVGLFGVMSYAVSRRTTEFGIRMALDAQQRTVLESVVLESFVVGWRTGTRAIPTRFPRSAAPWISPSVRVAHLY
jgi:hypothetical protein